MFKNIASFFNRAKPFFNFRTTADLGSSGNWITDILRKQSIVTDEGALQLSTYFSCVRVIAETVMQIPLKCYERLPDNKGKVEYNDYFLNKVIEKPNQNMTGSEYMEQVTAHLAIRGNHYSGINYDRGYVKELIPMKPDKMYPELVKNKIIYVYYDELGDEKVYNANRIHHVRILSTDGVVGLSPISYARKALKLSISAEDHGTKYYDNGTRTSGFVKHPRFLKEKAKKNLEKSLNKKASGENKFRTVVLEEGMDWIQSGLSNEDSQYLQTRQFQVEEVCRFLRVPPILVQHPNKMASYASTEQFFLSFIPHCIGPYLRKHEQRINKFLVPPEDQDRVFFEFKVESLLRGDLLARYKAYMLGRQGGWLSPNDIRRKENMNPREDEGGDDYSNPNINVDINKIKDHNKPPDKGEDEED